MWTTAGLGDLDLEPADRIMAEEKPNADNGEQLQEEAGTPMSRNPLRRLYDWVLSWARSPWGGVALFVLAFCESSFFPVPPDVLLLALVMGRRKRAFHYAAICTAGSILGGIAGYLLGMTAAPLAKSMLIGLTSEDLYYSVAVKYGENAFAAIAIAGFTPIPYKVFTITAGIFSDFVPLSTLILGSLLSRTARFFLISGLIYFFGPTVRRIIDRYFNILSIVFVVLLVGGFVLIARGSQGSLEPSVRVRILVRELSHGDEGMRVRAYGELRKIADKIGEPGPEGFDPAGSPELNRPVLERWDAWSKKIAPVVDRLGLPQGEGESGR